MSPEQTDLVPEKMELNIVYEDDDLMICLLYTSDAADERSSVDLGGRRIIKKKNESIPGHSPEV